LLLHEPPTFATKSAPIGDVALIAPAWPLDDRPIEELRRSPQPDLGKLTIKAIVDHYDRLIREMPEPPILIGRSFGGLFVQKLLDRGLGAVGVAIEPAAPKAVAPTLTVLWEPCRSFEPGWDGNAHSR
jgi:hypothetical protein